MNPYVKGKVSGLPPLANRRGRCAGTQADVETLNVLAGYVTSQGWNIFFEKGGEDCMVPETRNITIDSSVTYKSQIFSLLHEAGHLVLIGRPDYKEMYPDGYDMASGGPEPKTRKYRIDVLREEIAAWDEAERVAKSLNLNINLRDMREVRNSCLMSYIELFEL